MLLGEKNVGRLATLGDVIEVQAKHRRETRRDSCRRRVGVRDGNADLPVSRLVALSCLA
jgi:hypothetical protein